ncbi:gp035 [Rhodococcus phage ReqiDocB7]|uniref:gp035 n=1 Tax=Rhodococcus phage ReqiDocB7 TaxID=691966 RepID=UPI0001CDD765|nr:gp035 [Rhodococcus phage ReqiDocB7]ADD80821.1 gp035 [Rhodococcus phage ReqiDocB7]
MSDPMDPQPQPLVHFYDNERIPLPGVNFMDCRPKAVTPEEVTNPKDLSALESADSSSSSEGVSPVLPVTQSRSLPHPVQTAPAVKASGKPKESAPSTQTS